MPAPPQMMPGCGALPRRPNKSSQGERPSPRTLRLKSRMATLWRSAQLQHATPPCLCCGNLLVCEPLKVNMTCHACSLEAVAFLHRPQKPAMPELQLTKTRDLVPLMMDPFGQAGMSAMAMQEGAFGAGVYSSAGSVGKGAYSWFHPALACMSFATAFLLSEPKHSVMRLPSLRKSAASQILLAGQYKTHGNTPVEASASSACKAGFLIYTYVVAARPQGIHSATCLMSTRSLNATLACCSEPEEEEGERPGIHWAVKADVCGGVLLCALNWRELHELRPPCSSGAAV